MPRTISFRALSQSTALAAVLILASCAPADQGEAQQPDVLSRVSPAIELRSEGPPTISIVSPVDGAVVKSPFVVEVETENIALAPAGFSRDGEGHFHIRIGNGCMPAGKVLPTDDQTVHVGTGASTKEIDLPPGEYELCTQIGDGFHVGTNVTDTVTIRVTE